MAGSPGTSCGLRKGPQGGHGDIFVTTLQLLACHILLQAAGQGAFEHLVLWPSQNLPHPLSLGQQ